jgi:hypothetical protein
MFELLSLVAGWLHAHDLLHLCAIATVSTPLAAWIIRSSKPAQARAA